MLLSLPVSLFLPSLLSHCKPTWCFSLGQAAWWEVTTTVTRLSACYFLPACCLASCASCLPATPPAWGGRGRLAPLCRATAHVALGANPQHLPECLR